MKFRLLLGVWATAAILMYWMMSHNPGISPDAIVYLDTARSILAGQGFLFAGLPMTHFPPVYPLLLAAMGLVDPDLLHAARLLHAFLFGVNVVLVASAVYLACERRIRPAVCAVLLFVVSASVLDLHAMAWSEPAFFAFMLSGLLVLAAQVAHPSRRLLVLAATCLGLAMATRYVGITLLPVLLVALWFMGQRSLRDRVRDTLVAVPLALGPLGLWLLRNLVTSSGATDRTIAWHPVGRAQFEQLVQTLGDYVAPLDLSVMITAGGLVGMFALLFWCWRAVTHTAEAGEGNVDLARSLSSILLIFSATYIGFLLVSISLVDALTPLDDRLLFPLFGCLVIVAVVLGDRIVRVRPGRQLRWATAGLALASIGARAVPAVTTVIRVHRDGSGYTSEEWLTSPVIHQLGVLPPRMLIYANESEAAEYLASRPVLELPDSISWEEMKPNPRYRSQIGVLCRRVSEGRAVVAYLKTAGVGDADQQASIEKACPFGHVTHFLDGTIYSAEPLSPKPASGGSD